MGRVKRGRKAIGKEGGKEGGNKVREEGHKKVRKKEVVGKEGKKEGGAPSHINDVAAHHRCFVADGSF
jgi:hypothetical protein